MQAQITSLDRKTRSSLAVHRQKPSTEPSLAPCTAPSWAFTLQPRPPTWQIVPIPDTHPLIPWTSALNYSIPSQDTKKEESKSLWSFPPSEPADPSLPLGTRFPWYWSTRKSSEKNSLVPRTPHKRSTFSSAPVQSSACDRVQSKATASPWQGLSWQSQLQRNRLMLIYPLSTAFQGVGAFEESKAIGSSCCFPRRGNQLSRKLNKQIKEESF